MRRVLFVILFPIGFPAWLLVRFICSIYEKSKKKQIPQEEFAGNGYDFEKYVAELLKKNGFKNVEVTRASGDFGVDVLASYNRKRYGVQCKLYTRPVGNKAVQEIAAGICYYGCDRGAIITNNRFTSSAVKLAEANKIILWDNESLQKLINGKFRLT